ncbi:MULTISPECIES: sugar phosphate nucleotidyltransferase [Brevibacillus]|jgi:mannose-1-phosphate guanylyltransferase|uniref:Mannose-1-phosphate guanylyltransferase n=1 Tax=Brevibacillus aydinogluensis TaxID=927786 RepID=A0AA48RF59_9BACL|nr:MULTISPECIES: sugar phosphate nucleotidyltransferase [Bacillales]MDT3414294.1 mannose-1-phosphate guanylyltransferase [Brevibacillus aydinogluensis]UFJ59891.1 cupin domain-containing protein [Anoxybacillus sediminis]CAJ1003488.1 Mannose-1-phosphate guanylyltransferase [Brevibacillus aydinogluensis]
MKLILLSGGSGKRLWPLSNDVRSKQFLKMLRNPNGELESMVQRLWRQLAANGLLDSLYVSTSKTQADMIVNQLGTEVPLILEPKQRDTFPAIALAASFLYSREGVDLQETVAVMPVDPYVGEDFFALIKQLEHVLDQSGADLALIGVTPTYPSSKYGYIVPAESKADKIQPQMYRVLSFTEKPSEEQAKWLLKRRALWNCGVFAFRLETMIKELEKRGYPVEYDALIQQYDRLPAISFDYEVVEKAERVVVVPYDGEWKDLGTWNTITEEMTVNLVGKGHLDNGCTNTHVINELDLPIVVIGTSDVVVAASPDGILVSDKAKSHRIKDIAKEWNHRPMFEERRWGWYQAIGYQTTDSGAEVLTKRLHIHAERNLSYQYHRHRSEVWVIVAGEGEFVLDDRLRHVQAGDVLEIPVGAKHAIKATADLDIIEVQMGDSLVEDDIVRLCLSWEEIMERVNRDQLEGGA